VERTDAGYVLSVAEVVGEGLRPEGHTVWQAVTFGRREQGVFAKDGPRVVRLVAFLSDVRPTQGIGAGWRLRRSGNVSTFGVRTGLP